MDAKTKQQWSVEETNCLLALWSSGEIQNKLEGATRNKNVFAEIQREMGAAGFERTVEQIVNKLKKLKKDYRDQKKELARNACYGRPRRNPHFDVLDSVLGGDRPACNDVTTATAMMLEAAVLRSCPGASCPGAELSDVELLPPLDAKTKQQWSVEETNCLLALWSSGEIQNKLEGATRNKNVFAEIQREMVVAGFERTVDQIVNKLKKIKKDYRDQKKELGRNGNGRPRRSPHFDVLDSVLGGDRPACNVTGALNSATAMLEATVLRSCPGAELSDATADIELLPPLDRSSSLPMSSSPAQSMSSSPTRSSSPVNRRSSLSSQQGRRGKRRREANEDILRYMEMADERFSRHMERTDAFLSMMETKMDADTSALTGIMGLLGRMVAVMERGEGHQNTTSPHT